MKTKFISRSLITLTITLFVNVFSQTNSQTARTLSLSPTEIKEYIGFLAADKMKGRNTPSPELDTCANYISSHFKKWGLKPLGSDESFFQTFNVLKTRLGAPNSFAVQYPDTQIYYRIKYDFVPVAYTANREVTAPVVFAGYGITAPEYNYDDYKNIDVKGKFVMFFTNEPQEKDSASVFKGTEPTEHSKLTNKLINAQNHGAAGAIVVTAPLYHRFRKPPNTWPSLMRHAPKNAVPLTFEENPENKIVVVKIGKNLAEKLVSGLGLSIEELQKNIDNSLTPQSKPIPEIKITIHTTLKAKKTPVKNIIGIIPGSDPEMKNQAVIIGAHYDHLGVKNDTIIYNGADDNASGSAGVMALARMFSILKNKPKRSLVFCTWAGEEKGLFGSRYYTGTDPRFPLAKTIAYINLDMIGRSDSSYVRISGINSGSLFKELLDKYSEECGITYSGRKSVSGSDHVSFFSKNIPVLGFNTGLHKDYHKPTDTLEKIDLNGEVKICNLVFKLTKTLADSSVVPEFKENTE